MIKDVVRSIVEAGATLTREQSRSLVFAMLQTRTDPAYSDDVDIAALLTALATRGETVDELTGFAEAMRSLSVPVPLTDDERAELVDTCGTGGGGPQTFNISTGAALVAAAAGAKVAKHGNRSVTSQCGSADVLEALGIAVDLPPELSVECLRATGFMFLYAPALHPALKRVQPVRRALGFRTIFNLAGPLANPAHAPAQVMGVTARDKLMLVANAMAKLGVRRAFVVHGSDGLDELTITGESNLAEVRERTVALYRTKPQDVGLGVAPLEMLSGGDAAVNAQILERILNGQKGARRDIVLFNAAAALVVAEMADDIVEGVGRAAEAIDSGAALRTLEHLRRYSIECSRNSGERWPAVTGTVSASQGNSSETLVPRNTVPGNSLVELQP